MTLRTLVTGATGFVGRHLVRTLIDHGANVRALVRSDDAEDRPSLGAEIVNGDVRDAAIVREAVAGCGRVFHLAALVGGPHSLAEYRATNLEGTRNVADACLASGVERMVYVSTAGVHGRLRSAPANEESPIRPNSHYRVTKWLAEKHLLDVCHRRALPIVIARLTDTVGEGALSWLGLCRAIASPGFRPIGSGRASNQLCHVSDAVSGLLRCGDRPHLAGKTYLISGKRPIPIAELLTWFADALGVGAPERSLPGAPFVAALRVADGLYRRFGIVVPALSRYEFFVAEKAYDLRKAEDELGFVPEKDAHDGVREAARWYREAGYL